VHAAGVVHRDLKEANIVMREADGRPVLVDFGSAGYEGAPRLTAVLPPGTPEYRSPEAVRFAQDSCPSGPYQASPGDDFWALGVTLYGLLTRGLPFGDRQSAGMNRAILEEAPTPPHVRNPRVPPVLSALCVRMLEKAPAARYADARQVDEALKAVLAEADDTWRVPLFPKGKRKKALASIPLAVSRASLGKRLWVVSLVLISAVVVSVLLLHSTPRSGPLTKALALQPTELSPPTPPHQVIPRQELASANATAEVVAGAGPQKSPTTPAPVAVSATHREEPKMMKSMKSKTARALTAATCLAGSACAGGPQHRPPPQEEDCPPGSDEMMRHLDVYFGSRGIVIVPFDHNKETPEYAYVPEGKVTVQTIGGWGVLPSRSYIYGEMFFSKGKLYGFFTQARLPNGDIVPICMQLSPALDILPGSTAKVARVDYYMLDIEPIQRASK
jgi:serine/threonine-protein kinase